MTVPQAAKHPASHRHRWNPAQINSGITQKFTTEGTVHRYVSGQAPALKSLNHVGGPQMHLAEREVDKGAKDLGTQPAKCSRTTSG